VSHSFFTRGLLPAMLLAASHPLAAQALPDRPPVVNPALAVEPVEYRSVFADLPRGVEAGSIDWREANDQVGQFRRGHVDILRWEQQQDAATPRPTEPRKTTGHQGHGVAP
jgi:hypothetical protein